MAVSKRARYEVLRRDGHRCRYCGATADDGSRLTVDHVVPVALGGADTPDNLVAACIDCNAGKSSTPTDAALVATVSDDAMRWSAAMREAGTAILAEMTKDDAELDAFDAEWKRWARSGREVYRPDGWGQSIASMLATGVPIDVLIRLVEVAMTTRKVLDGDVWRYFCGCAWRTVARMREHAAASLAVEQADEWMVSFYSRHERRFIDDQPFPDRARALAHAAFIQIYSGGHHVGCVRVQSLATDEVVLLNEMPSGGIGLFANGERVPWGRDGEYAEALAEGDRMYLDWHRAQMAVAS